MIKKIIIINYTTKYNTNYINREQSFCDYELRNIANDNLFSIDSNQFNYKRRKKNTVSHHLQTNSIISEFLKIENSAERLKKKIPLFKK